MVLVRLLARWLTVANCLLFGFQELACVILVPGYSLQERVFLPTQLATPPVFQAKPHPAGQIPLRAIMQQYE